MVLKPIRWTKHGSKYALRCAVQLSVLQIPQSHDSPKNQIKHVTWIIRHLTTNFKSGATYIQTIILRSVFEYTCQTLVDKFEVVIFNYGNSSFDEHMILNKTLPRMRHHHHNLVLTTTFFIFIFFRSFS